MFVLEFYIGIIHVGRILVKILNKTSACAVLFLPSVAGPCVHYRKIDSSLACVRTRSIGESMDWPL